LHWIVVLGLAWLFLMASPVLAAANAPQGAMAFMTSLAPQPIPKNACPQLHTINPNEKRLVQITDWYGLDLATVAALNAIDADASLTTGDMLCLAAPTPQSAVRSVPVSGCSQLHTVNPNEKQLVQITDWYGLDLATVAALSGIPADASLTTGDMVCLAGPATRAPAPRPIPANACPKLHTVNPNEKRLVQITDWYGLDLATVAALNGMAADAPLTTGSMLCLSSIVPPRPAPTPQPIPTSACPRLHTVNPNEKQLVQITDWYGLDLATVAALNGMAADAPLTTGSMLCLTTTAATGSAMMDEKAEAPVSTAAPQVTGSVSVETAATESAMMVETPVNDTSVVAEETESLFHWCDQYPKLAERETCWWRENRGFYNYGFMAAPGSPFITTNRFVIAAGYYDVSKQGGARVAVFTFTAAPGTLTAFKQLKSGGLWSATNKNHTSAYPQWHLTNIPGGEYEWANLTYEDDGGDIYTLRCWELAPNEHPDALGCFF